MPQIFGDFIEVEDDNQEYLKIGFSPSSVPLQQRWRNNGLSADFLADYLVTFFPGEDKEALDRQAEIKDAISYIANELLENAMKYSYAPVHHAVSIGMLLDQDKVRFYVTNSIDPEQTRAFQSFIYRLLMEDPDELYMEQLLSDEEEKKEGGGGLGFLTMLNDYGAHLAWKFQPSERDPEVMLVTTLVQLPIE